MTYRPARRLSPMTTRHRTPVARTLDTLEIVAFAHEDRAAAAFEVARQVERVERGDLCPSEGYGFPAWWWLS